MTVLVDNNWTLTPDGLKLVEALEKAIPANLDGVAYLQAVHGTGGAFCQSPQSAGTFFGRNPGIAARLWEVMQPTIAAAEPAAPAGDTLADYAAGLETKLRELEAVFQESQKRQFWG